ncbi:MAG: hypothetical protein ACREEM_00575 [Blastocatellia bacterium]
MESSVVGDVTEPAKSFASSAAEQVGQIPLFEMSKAGTVSSAMEKEGISATPAREKEKFESDLALH